MKAHVEQETRPSKQRLADLQDMTAELERRLYDARETLERELGSKYFRKLSVTFDYTTVASDDGGTRRDTAFAKAQELAASPDAAAKVIQADAAKGQEAQAGFRVPAVQAPALAASVLFGVRAGTVVTFEADDFESRIAFFAMQRFAFINLFINMNLCFTLRANG